MWSLFAGKASGAMRTRHSGLRTDALGRSDLEVATSDPICGGERVEPIHSDWPCGENCVGTDAAEAEA